MPFDDTTGIITPRRDPTIQRMREFFGPNGEMWSSGSYVDQYGRRCVVGALMMTMNLGTSNFRDRRVIQHPVFIAMTNYANNTAGHYETPQLYNDYSNWKGIKRMLDAVEKELTNAVR